MMDTQDNTPQTGPGSPDRNPRARVFISYKRNVSPDEPIAREVFEALSRDHDVFIDHLITVGTHWAARIEEEIRKSDFMIVFLSKDSVHSEMILGEVSLAAGLAREQARPVIFPVRLQFRNPLHYPMNAYLDHINWTDWESPHDTPRLIEELRTAINGSILPRNQATSEPSTTTSEVSSIPHPEASAQPRFLEMPEGTMDSESRLYVKRDADRIAAEAIKRQGVTITIKGPRQIGKSSLLIRTIGAAASASKRIAFLDFQLFENAALRDADTFFRQFCTWLSDELEIEDKTAEYWSRPLGNPQRCTSYVGRYLLKEIRQPLVLAMDEVETVFDTDFRSDFFAMLRSWHNDRAIKPNWKRLDLVLVTSTEPYQLISNLNQSPFNVGEILQLNDFSSEQLRILNSYHDSPLTDDELNRIEQLLGGHPYLTRRAMYWIATRRMSFDELFRNATEDRGPFGDHLRYHLFRLRGNDALIRAFNQVIQGEPCPDDLLFFRLRGAGLVSRKENRTIPRCRLYAEYFAKHLNE